MHRIDTADAVANRFNDNVAIQNPTTRVTAAWLNDVQENLVQVIEAAGIALDKGNGGQLLAALQVMFAAVRTPVGTVGSFHRTTPPSEDWLPYDGAEYLKADYPALVAIWSDDGLLVDGSSAAHFVVPNYEGRFARNISSSNAVDPAGPRTPGSLQADEYKAHTHGLPVRSDANTGDGWVEDSDGTGTARTAFTASSGGLETRPKNVALLWCVLGR